jgi:hypothetical protein
VERCCDVLDVAARITFARDGSGGHEAVPLGRHLLLLDQPQVPNLVSDEI